MKIIAIDTTTKYLVIALYDNGPAGEYTVELGRKHSALAAPIIQRVLKYAGWDIREVDYFGCGIGPGSFTGTRVGVATVKGISWAMTKPVVALPSLDVLALNAADCPGSSLVVPVIDAKRNLVYAAVYRRKGGDIKRQGDYMLVGADELCRRLKGRVTLLGDALGIYGNLFRSNLPQAEILDKDYWDLRANNLLECALKNIRAKKITDTFRVDPLYLYEQTCQIRVKK